MEYSIRSKYVSRLVYFQKEDFLSLLKNYPEDYERFCYLRDLTSLSHIKQTESWYYII